MRRPPWRVASWFWARDVPTPGELLNDEIVLVEALGPFDPDKIYRVRYSFRGREFLGEWDEAGLSDEEEGQT